jgi:hypothetical protein
MLMPPAAALPPAHPPVLVVAGNTADEDDEDDDSVFIFWKEGLKYKVSLQDYETVGDLLEAVRVQAKHDGCEQAPIAHPPDHSEDWARLVLPSESGGVERQTILKCGDSLAAGGRNYRALNEGTSRGAHPRGLAAEWPRACCC